MAEIPVVNIRLPSGPNITLTLDEFWLALLGLVDFEGDWEALQTAAGLVTDGETKAALISDRILPVAEYLTALLQRGVDAFELLTARHWFRHRACQTVSPPPIKAPGRSDSQDGLLQQDEL